MTRENQIETFGKEQYQRGFKAGRAGLLAENAKLQEAVKAALRMVDGDGNPPDWDMLRAALKESEGAA